MDNADEDDDVPFSQMVDRQQDPVLPDHNFGLNTPTGSPEFARSYSKQHRRHGKVFNDPIHDIFRLDPVSIDIMDSVQFQRLRDLRQLGMTYYVFPGASHNRFEHSLGTAHLAFEVADKIWNSQRAELGMERSDVKIVELAGADVCLCCLPACPPCVHSLQYLRSECKLHRGRVYCTADAT